MYGITNDDFIRTTEERHKKVVQKYVARLMKTGDIYLAEYEGWYCVPDEAYWTETQVVDGKCPDCGRPVELLKEESYFFKMSAYSERLVKHIETHPTFIMPETRRNEVLGFIKQGLRDISVSRTTITWGIPMPADPKATKEHKIYVWFDALTNYISALDPASPRYDTFWKEAIHLVGKDILRFHAVYWPTFLMALGLPFPKHIVAHGWLTDSNKKISKSTGNAIDPIELASEVGIDGMRYFLFREFVFGQDGEYTKEVMYRRINGDLANDFGNSVSRVCSMMLKYLGDGPLETGTKDARLAEISSTLVDRVSAELEKFQYHRALEAIWQLITFVNRDIDTVAPWALAKSEKLEDKGHLKTSLLTWHEALRQAAVLMLPFIPASAAKALDTMGAAESASHLDKAHLGRGPAMIQIKKPSPLFPRLEWKDI
jgi:methionyl-tRNA synthetase